MNKRQKTLLGKIVMGFIREATRDGIPPLEVIEVSQVVPMFMLKALGNSLKQGNSLESMMGVEESGSDLEEFLDATYGSGNDLDIEVGEDEDDDIEQNLYYNQHGEVISKAEFFDMEDLDGEGKEGFVDEDDEGDDDIWSKFAGVVGMN